MVRKRKWARRRVAGVSGVETKWAQDIFPSFVKSRGILADGRHFINGAVREKDGKCDVLFRLGEDGGICGRRAGTEVYCDGRYGPEWRVWAVFWK